MELGHTIAFVGAGNMGEALIKGLIKAGTVKPEQLRASDARDARRDYLSDTYGITIVAANREAVETAIVPAVGGSALTIPAGGMVRFDLPGSGANPLDLVSKITTSSQVYVFVASAGEFDTYLKQYNVPSI